MNEEESQIEQSNPVEGEQVANVEESPQDPTQQPVDYSDKLDKIIENQEKLIEHNGKITEFNQSVSDFNQSVSDFNEKQAKKDADQFDELLLKLGEYNQSIVDSQSDDISHSSVLVEKLDKVIEQQEQIIEHQDDLVIGANTITTYGVVYIPLAIVIFLLARFFFTFMKTYR